MKSGIATIIVFIYGLVGASVYAVNVQPGQSYLGQVKLEFPNMGTSFMLPSGWTGIVPKGKEVFVLANNSLDGIGLIGIQRKAAATVLQEMRNPIPFLGNTKLILRGSVQRKGNSLFGLYQVQGSQVPMVAYVVSVFGDDGRVVAFLVAARQSNMAKLGQDMELMMASVTIKKPVTPVNTVIPGGGNNARNSELGRLLSGLKLTFMKTWSTTRTTIDIYLCKNGTFHRKEIYGGVSGPGTMVGRNANRGRWSMSGTQGFILHYNNGKVVNKRVTFQGSKLFLNGVRYFRNGSAGC